MQDGIPETTELILALEYGASRRVGAIRSVTGTLILTNLRLVFIHGDSLFYKDRDLRGAYSFASFDIPPIYYTEIYDARDIPTRIDSKTSHSISIEIQSMVSVTGERELLQNPTLKVTWRPHEDIEEVVNEEFRQQVIGSRQKNLNDWARVISKLKLRELDERVENALKRTVDSPSMQTLEGKVFYILGDLQCKDIFEIMEQIERRFGGSLDPDDVAISCSKLIEEGWLDQITGENVLPDLYRRTPPLGEEYDVSDSNQ